MAIVKLKKVLPADPLDEITDSVAEFIETLHLLQDSINDNAKVDMYLGKIQDIRAKIEGIIKSPKLGEGNPAQDRLQEKLSSSALILDSYTKDLISVACLSKLKPNSQRYISQIQNSVTIIKSSLSEILSTVQELLRK